MSLVQLQTITTALGVSLWNSPTQRQTRRKTVFWKQSQPKPVWVCFYWPGVSQLLQFNTRMDGGIGKLPDEELVDEESLHLPLTQLVRLSLMKSPPPSAPRLLPSLQGRCKFWLWFLSFPQHRSAVDLSLENLMHQLSYNLIRDRFPSLLHCHSLSHLSHCLSFNSNSTQHSNSLSPNMSPHHLFSWHARHDCLPFYTAPTSFFTQFFFSAIAFWASTLILSAWHQRETDWSQPFPS